MNDLIERSAVINLIDKYTQDMSTDYWTANYGIPSGVFEDEIIDLPSAQPEQRWIPCSERLPEAKQRVLVTFPDGTVDIKICIDAGHLKWFFAHMVAWMPLPEPYQSEAERRADE